MSEEIQSLHEMQTWILVKKPENEKPLTCRWVLCKKDNGRYKARLVIRSFEQKKRINYYNVFSPVARHISIRLIHSIAAPFAQHRSSETQQRGSSWSLWPSIARIHRGISLTRHGCCN